MCKSYKIIIFTFISNSGNDPYLKPLHINPAENSHHLIFFLLCARALNTSTLVEEECLACCHGSLLAPPPQTPCLCGLQHPSTRGTPLQYLRWRLSRKLLQDYGKASLWKCLTTQTVDWSKHSRYQYYFAYFCLGLL